MKLNLNIFKSFFATNLIFLILFIFLLFISAMLEIKYVKDKLFTTKKITYLAAFIAVISIVNIAVVYFSGWIFHQKFIIFVEEGIVIIPGMLFGPLSGIICGLCSDTITSLATGLFEYHFGFTFEVLLLGFIGGLVWLFANEKNWIFYIIILYIISSLIIDFLIKPICLVSIGVYPNYKFAYSWLIIYLMLIKFIIFTPLYLFIFFLLFKISYQICAKSFNDLWCNKNVKEIYFLEFKKMFRFLIKKKFKNNKKDLSN